MSTITPEELYHLLTSQPATPLLDVRTPVEFAEVHVARARNLPLDQLQPATLLTEGALPAERPVYLLCRSGARAQKAADQLRRGGFRQPVVVTGGTLAWLAAGLPVERGAAMVISLERQVRIAAGALVLTGVLLGWLVHPAAFGLAALVGGGLVFAGVTDYCGMGLLLAKLPWNRRVSGAGK